MSRVLTRYDNVKLPTETHRRARILALALRLNLSQVYTEAIFGLWRRSRHERAGATRELKSRPAWARRKGRP